MKLEDYDKAMRDFGEMFDEIKSPRPGRKRVDVACPESLTAVTRRDTKWVDGRVVKDVRALRLEFDDKDAGAVRGDAARGAREGGGQVILVDFSYQDKCGVVVEHPTGIIWTSQVGGIACAHPEVEGFFIPLDWNQSVSCYPFQDAWWPTSVVDESEPWCVKTYDRREIQNWLDSVPELAAVLEAREDFKGWWGEAWIPVRVREGIRQFDPLHGVSGMLAILLLDNSD